MSQSKILQEECGLPLTGFRTKPSFPRAISNCGFALNMENASCQGLFCTHRHHRKGRQPVLSGIVTIGYIM